MKLESLLQYMDAFLEVPGHPDYPNALNGLQCAGPEEVAHVCAAVDASEAAIGEALEREADLLVVHHGLFWDGVKPLTGRRYRKAKALIEGGLALYSVHLPLDAHREVGNCAILASEIGLDVQGRFGSFEGVEIGWWGHHEGPRDALALRLEAVVGGPVHVVEGGPEAVLRVGVLTGGGASFVPAAAQAGLDTLVTGEGAHHTVIDAHEYGVNLMFAGHYATETFGVKALASHVAERFDLTWEFLDLPTGM